MSHISFHMSERTKPGHKLAELAAKGALIWLDRNSINPGQIWQDAIRDGIDKEISFWHVFRRVPSESERASWMKSFS